MSARRISILGIGAMGCLFGGRLNNLAIVTLFGTWPAQLSVLQRDGLRLIQATGLETRHQIRAMNLSDANESSDLVLILVKHPQTHTAAVAAAKVLAPDGLVLTLQNGLGNLGLLAEVVGSDRVSLGVTSEGATVIEPGVVRHAGPGLTHLAATPGTFERLEWVASLFREAGFHTDLVEDPDSLVWGKLCVNAGINPLTALLRVPNGYLAENSFARSLMSSTAQEVADVAAARGIELPFASAADQVLQVAQGTASNYSSMLQDVLRGVPTEIDAICGAVVRAGQQASVPTPFNTVLLKLIRAETENGDWRSLVTSLPAEIRTLFVQLEANL